jgi:hypothetical protein
MTLENVSTGTLIQSSPQQRTRGKPRKFTPEKLQQVRNLVEQGTSREAIAEILDVTVGSLQVTCSRAGISLRRPKVGNGVPLVAPVPKNAINMHFSGDHGIAVSSQPTEGPSQGNLQLLAAERVSAAKLKDKQVLGASSTSVAIKFQYKGMERTAELPLTRDMIGQLAWEAEFRNMRIGELIAELIAAVVKKGLLPTVIGKP